MYVSAVFCWRLPTRYPLIFRRLLDSTDWTEDRQSYEQWLTCIWWAAFTVSRGNKWMSLTLMTFMFGSRTSVFTLCVIYSYISGRRCTFEIFIGAAERRVEPPGSILLIPSSFIYTETLWVIRKCIKTQRWSLHVDAGWWWGWGNRQ